MDATDLGRGLVYVGIGLAVLGGLVLIAGRFVDFGAFGNLPGDVRYESENVRFYFPITTMIVVSIVLTVVLNLILRLFR